MSGISNQNFEDDESFENVPLNGVDEIAKDALSTIVEEDENEASNQSG